MHLQHLCLLSIHGLMLHLPHFLLIPGLCKLLTHLLYFHIGARYFAETHLLLWKAHALPSSIGVLQAAAEGGLSVIMET